MKRLGRSFNDLCLKGSSQLNSSLKVLLGFSTFPFCLMTDLSSAHTSCKTGQCTNSCRRFWWFLDANDENSLVELIFVVSTFGDKPSRNILGQELSYIAMDNKVSENTRQFILNHYYLDDGLSKQRLINIKDEPPGTFGRYSFAVKHVLLNFQ